MRSKVLDPGLLIDADDNRVGRRVEVEADHVPDLGLQRWIGGELERLEPVRLQSPV